MDSTMTLALLVALVLTFVLIAALLVPEKFS